MDKLFKTLVVEVTKEVIRTNRKPDKMLTSQHPKLEVLDGNGQVTPHYIALQVRQIVDEIMKHLN